jgi:ABC-type glycerol-3-phosphate transport system substrate-binding protein
MLLSIIMNKKQVLAPATGALILILAILATALFILPALRKPVIAYYGLPDNVRGAITALADDPALSGKTKFGIIVLDPAKPLGEQIGKKPRIDVLFAYDGAAAADIASKALTPSEQIRALMAPAIQQTGKVRATTYGMPLLLDHFEVAYNTALFGKAGFGEPKRLDELVAAARKTARKGMWPVVCAGANDADLLMLVGALSESRYGAESRAGIVRDLREKGSFEAALGNKALKGTLDELIAWRKDGLLHPEWFRMQTKDVIAFMENEYAGIVFMPLSTHRTIPLKTIAKFASIPFPPIAVGVPREITAPVIIGILPSYKKPDARAADFLYRLARAEGQTIISAETGLAPVNSTAEAQDIQASDVRLWAAASGRPVPDPVTDAFADPAKVTATARSIRSYIESNGAGF